MQLNYVAILIATVLQFIVGAVWYGFLFGKLWGKIHGFDKLTKAQQEKMQSEVGPLYGIQLVMTLITTFVLALFMAALPRDWNAWGMAGFFWLGFVVPAQVSAALFGGAPVGWVKQKIFVQAGASLTCQLLAATVLHYAG